MWKSLFMDMYESLAEVCSDLSEAVVLGVHVFNISKGLQCTGLQDDDPSSHDMLPEGWNRNRQLYSFRYLSKSLTVSEKFIRINSTKLNIHAVRSDQPEKILHFPIDLSGLVSDYAGTAFAEALIAAVLLPYEREVLGSLVGESSAPAVDRPKEENSRRPVAKTRSVLEDDSVPFGLPYSRGGFQNSNPYSSPFMSPGDLVGPGHPIFARNPPGRGARWDPVGPFYMPGFPDHFQPPGPHGPPGPPGSGGFHPPNGYF